jgi:hypothetical protein
VGGGVSSSVRYKRVVVFHSVIWLISEIWDWEKSGRKKRARRAAECISYIPHTKSFNHEACWEKEPSIFAAVDWGQTGEELGLSRLVCVVFFLGVGVSVASLDLVLWTWPSKLNHGWVYCHFCRRVVEKETRQVKMNSKRLNGDNLTDLSGSSR